MQMDNKQSKFNTNLLNTKTILKGYLSYNNITYLIILAFLLILAFLCLLLTTPFQGICLIVLGLLIAIAIIGGIVKTFLPRGEKGPTSVTVKDDSRELTINNFIVNMAQIIELMQPAPVPYAILNKDAKDTTDIKVLSEEEKKEWPDKENKEFFKQAIISATTPATISVKNTSAEEEHAKNS